MERKIDKKMFRSVIIYGIGQYYKTIKPELFAQIKPDYLCDRKWDTDAPERSEEHTSELQSQR